MGCGHGDLLYRLSAVEPPGPRRPASCGRGDGGRGDAIDPSGACTDGRGALVLLPTLGLIGGAVAFADIGRCAPGWLPCPAPGGHFPLATLGGAPAHAWLVGSFAHRFGESVDGWLLD